MNESLMDIYRQQVLAHSREPHNQRCITPADREATGFNPLCGDKLIVYMRIEADTVAEVAFEGSGCAISVASASMMTDALTGVHADTASQLIDDVSAMFADGALPQSPKLQAIRALENVREYPSRVKCATLAWTAAAAALGQTSQNVTTE